MTEASTPSEGHTRVERPPIPPPEGAQPIERRPSAATRFQAAATLGARTWLVPFVVLTAIAVLILYSSHLIDGGRGFLDALRRPDGDVGASVLSSAGQIVCGVLGVAISVVAIIVELAAGRYTHRITELFFRAPTNFAVMGLFVVSAVHPMWVAFTYQQGSAPPIVGTATAMALMTISMMLLLPYFSYVAAFVNPLNVIARIKAETLASVERGPRSASKLDVERVQHASADGADQLSDIAFNSMVHHDNGIAMSAINAIGDLLRDYLDVKKSLPDEWFLLSDDVRQNPDFVSQAREALAELEKGRTWFEFKLLRQYEQIYRASLNEYRELNYVIATNVRELAENAMARGDKRVVDLAVQFFNTFLRATVNARDVRTGYNVLNQYRLLAEAALRRSEGRVAVSVAKYFKYYGQVAFHMDLGFILETAAYDLCTLNELALDLNVKERAEMLRVFLQVDKEGEGEKKEAALRGVRKAQVKLATYYLHKGDVAAAREVYRDMQDEQPLRLASIRDELLAVESPYFWEVTDRGTNFDWIGPERKRRLVEFFEWFGDQLPDPRVSVMPTEGSQLPALIRAVNETAAMPAVGNDTDRTARDPGASVEGAGATPIARRSRISTEEPSPRASEADR